MVGLSPQKSEGLPDVIERILDKGIVIHADIFVSVSGVELLGIRIRAALASFETAAKYGLAFPLGTNYDAPAWKTIGKTFLKCPECGNRLEEEKLKEEGCFVCGWAGPSKRKLVEAVEAG